MNIDGKKRFLIILTCIFLLLLGHGQYAPAQAEHDPSTDLSIHVGIEKSSGMSNASLTGTFAMCEYGADPNPWDYGAEREPWAGRLELIFNGNGTGTFEQIADSNEGTSSGPFTYAVSSDGTVSVDSGKYSGIVNAGGDMFVIVDTDRTDNDLSIHVGMKTSAGMTNASLNGTFIMCEYGTDPEPWAGRLELIFNGNGTGTFKQLADSNGGTSSGPFTYSLAADGVVSVNSKYSGIVSADGKMFVIVDTDKSDDDLSIHVGIKKSTGMTDADLNGTFIMGEYGTDPDPWAGRLKIGLAGDGTGTFEQIADSNGDAYSGSFTSSLAGDGTFKDNSGHSGIANTDGNVFVLVDANEPSDTRAMPWIPLLLLGE